jgi:hypothetical protein
MNRIALPIEMSTKQGSVVVSFTMSPDSRMFYVTLNKSLWNKLEANFTFQKKSQEW